MFDDAESISFISKAIEVASKMPHIMEFTYIRCLESFFALVRRGISNVIEYNDNHSDFPLKDN
jgi:dynein heavy chain 1